MDFLRGFCDQGGNNSQKLLKLRNFTSTYICQSKSQYIVVEVCEQSKAQSSKLLVFATEKSAEKLMHVI